jgi:EAL domain-containing protein (putative c-di-GMP-specific phosphodiesterase class I)/DNA-binding response OmpR family regulator
MSQAPQVEPAVATAVPGKKYVFAVSEHPEKLSYLNRALEGSNYALLLIHSLEQARTMMQERTPSALILDASVLKHGSDYQSSDRIPVLVVSDKDDFDTRIQAVRVNSDAFLCHPVDAVELQRKLDELTSSADSQAYRVLVVDDEIGVAELASVRLRQAGMKAEGLSEPEKIMDVMQAFKPDLVLMDLYMPGINGIELTRLIKQHEEFEHIPVIYLSAETDKQKQQEAVNAGADDFLTKPMDTEEMVRVVRQRIKLAAGSKEQNTAVVRTDHVTGLGDRLQFMSELQAIINDPEQYQHSVLIYVNLPGYVKLKMKDGQTIADAYIRHAAGKLHKACTSEHFKLARVAEDSIGIIAYGYERQEVKNIPARVHQCLASTSDESKHQIKGYIGAYILNDSKVEPQQAMYQAIIASEIAQQEGRQDVHVRGLNDEHFSDDELEKTTSIIIKRAIAANNVRLIYQPIVTLGGGLQEKYEVYMRLLDPEGRELAPDRCIPIAEKYNKMAEIDRMVFTHALDALATSRQKVKNTVFFIKVSAQTLKDDSFPNWLYGQLNRYKLPGSSIVLELKEQDVADSRLAAISFCGTMKALNCGLVLEHFGTRLDSAALLKALPADYIKLDGSYMVDLWRNKSNQDTVRHLTNEAHKKGALVIASFVEDSGSYDVLWNMGVNFLQGNYLQAPLQEHSYDFRVYPRIGNASH